MACGHGGVGLGLRRPGPAAALRQRAGFGGGSRLAASVAAEALEEEGDLGTRAVVRAHVREVERAVDLHRPDDVGLGEEAGVAEAPEDMEGALGRGGVRRDAQRGVVVGRDDGGEDGEVGAPVVLNAPAGDLRCPGRCSWYAAS